MSRSGCYRRVFKKVNTVWGPVVFLERRLPRGELTAGIPLSRAQFLSSHRGILGPAEPGGR